jgi:hypothetical protein
VATADVLTSTPATPPGCRPLHVPVVQRGRAAYPFDLAADRAHHPVARAELPPKGRALDAPAAALDVELP